MHDFILPALAFLIHLEGKYRISYWVIVAIQASSQEAFLSS